MSMITARSTLARSPLLCNDWAYAEPPYKPCSSPAKQTKTIVRCGGNCENTRAASTTPAQPDALSSAPGDWLGSLMLCWRES